MPQYTAILRMIFAADSDVDAELMSVSARQLVNEHVIELDHGDEAEVTWLGPNVGGTTAAELIATLTKARNDLILTKSGTCWDVAKEIDKIVYHLERNDKSFVGSYDYGHFFDVARKLLEEAGEDANNW